MKVLFLTGEYPPLQGGIADYTAHLIQSLSPLGVEPFVLTTHRWLEVQLPAANNPSSPLLSPPFHPSPLPACPHSIHPILPNWGFRCWPGITKFLRQHCPQILHIQYQAANFDLGGWVNWLPWYLRKRGMPVKIVTTFHDLRIPYIFPKAGRFRRQSMLALVRHSHAVICTNREDSLAINNEQSPKPRSPTLRFRSGQACHSFDFAQDKPSHLPLLTTIPLGTNIEPQPPAGFERSAWRAKLGLKPGTFLLAYFGFLNESKGGEELVEALARLHQDGLKAHLLLIGGDVGQADPTNIAYAQKVQALIEQYGLKEVVHRTGYVEQPEVSASLFAADALVMPYRDGVSFRRTTLLAALRHGCPIITTTPADLRLMPEIKPGENMLLVPPREAPALAQVIRTLAGDRALQQKLAQGAWQLSELFNWEQIAGQTLRVYQTSFGLG